MSEQAWSEESFPLPAGFEDITDEVHTRLGVDASERALSLVTAAVEVGGAVLLPVTEVEVVDIDQETLDTLNGITRGDN